MATSFIALINPSSSISLLSNSKLNPVPRIFSGAPPTNVFMHRNFRYLGSCSRKMNMIAVKCSAAPGSPLFPDPGSWKIWIVGVVISVIFPFWRNKWAPLLRLKEEVEMAVEVAEKVADIVEDVAEEVEKVAEEVSHHLPEGGRLQKAAIFVENIAKETDKYAHLAGDVIDKVQEVEAEVEAAFSPASQPPSQATD